MPKFKAEYSLNPNSSGVTQTAGTANTETRIIRWTVPRASKFLIRPTDIFWLSAKSSSTEDAGTARVRMAHSDPSQQVVKYLVDELYTVLNSTQNNRDSLYTIGQVELLQPDDYLDVLLTGDQAVTTAATVFRITMLREADVLSF